MNEDPELNQMIDEVAAEFDEPSGDWWRANARSLVQVGYPGVDFYALNRSASPAQFGRFMGIVKGYVLRIPVISNAMANASELLAAIGRKSRKAAFGKSGAKRGGFGWTLEVVGRSLKRYTPPYLRKLAEDYGKWEGKVFESVRHREEDYIASFFSSYAGGLYACPLSPSGAISAPEKQQKTFVVTRLLFFAKEVIGERLKKVPDLHRLVARIDTSGHFTKDEGSPQWDADFDCVEGVCRRIRLKLGSRGRPRNTAN